MATSTKTLSWKKQMVSNIWLYFDNLWNLLSKYGVFKKKKSTNYGNFNKKIQRNSYMNHIINFCCQNLCTNYLAPIMVVNRGLLFSCSWNGFLKNGSPYGFIEANHFQVHFIEVFTWKWFTSMKCTWDMITTLISNSLIISFDIFCTWPPSFQSIFDSSRNNCTMYCHSSSFPMNDQIEHNKCPCGG